MPEKLNVVIIKLKTTYFSDKVEKGLLFANAIDL